MISVIVPTLNEEGGISYCIRNIPRKINGERVEIIVVDGGSTDSTIEKVKSTDAKLVIERRKGKGIAMQTGVKNAKGDKIVFIDGDGEYNPKYISRLINLLPKCNMVEGYRVFKMKKVGLISKIFCLVALIVGSYIYRGFWTKDPVTGLRALRKTDWSRLNIKSRNFVVDTEIEIKAIKNNFKIIEFPIVQNRRKGGSSKFLRAFKDMIEIYKYVNKNKFVLNKPKNIITKV